MVFLQQAPKFILAAVTRNLATGARFLNEYSGLFWGMFSKIRPDIHTCFLFRVLYNKQYIDYFQITKIINNKYS